MERMAADGRILAIRSEQRGAGGRRRRFGVLNSNSCQKGVPGGLEWCSYQSRGAAMLLELSRRGLMQHGLLLHGAAAAFPGLGAITGEHSGQVIKSYGASFQS